MNCVPCEAVWCVDSSDEWKSFASAGCIVLLVSVLYRIHLVSIN